MTAGPRQLLVAMQYAGHMHGRLARAAPDKPALPTVPSLSQGCDLEKQLDVSPPVPQAGHLPIGTAQQQQQQQQ